MANPWEMNWNKDAEAPINAHVQIDELNTKKPWEMNLTSDQPLSPMGDKPKGYVGSLDQKNFLQWAEQKKTENARQLFPGLLGAFSAGMESGGFGRPISKGLAGLLPDEEFKQRVEHAQEYVPETTGQKAFQAAGSFFSGAPLMVAGGGVAGMAGKVLGLGAKALPILEAAGGGAAMTGGEEALRQAEGGNIDIGKVAKAAGKGAVTMAPLGVVGPWLSKVAPIAETTLGSIGIKAPTDAVVLGLSNAIYDHVTGTKPVNWNDVAAQIGGDIPGFMLINTVNAILSRGKGGPIQAPKTEGEPTPELNAEATKAYETQVEASLKAGLDKTAAHEEGLKAQDAVFAAQTPVEPAPVASIEGKPAVEPPVTSTVENEPIPAVTEETKQTIPPTPVAAGEAIPQESIPVEAEKPTTTQGAEGRNIEPAQEQTAPSLPQKTFAEAFAEHLAKNKKLGMNDAKARERAEKDAMIELRPKTESLPQVPLENLQNTAVRVPKSVDLRGYVTGDFPFDSHENIRKGAREADRGFVDTEGNFVTRAQAGGIHSSEARKALGIADVSEGARQVKKEELKQIAIQEAKDTTESPSGKTVKDLRNEVEQDQLGGSLKAFVADMSEASTAAETGLAGKAPIIEAETGRTIGWRNQGRVYPEGLSTKALGTKPGEAVEAFLSGRKLGTAQVGAVETIIDYLRNEAFQGLSEEDVNRYREERKAEKEEDTSFDFGDNVTKEPAADILEGRNVSETTKKVVTEAVQEAENGTVPKPIAEKVSVQSAPGDSGKVVERVSKPEESAGTQEAQPREVQQEQTGEVRTEANAESERGAKGADVGKLQTIAKSFKNAKVEIYKTVADLMKAHPEVGKVPNEAEGVYDKGVSYLISDNIKVGEEARVVAHEVVVHGGLRTLFGEEALTKVLKNTYLNDKNFERAVAEKMKDYGVERVEAIEEVLASLWEAREARPSMWRSLVANMKKALVKAGFDMNWTEKDIEALIAKARENVTGGKEGIKGQSTRLSLGELFGISKKFDPAELEANRRKWEEVVKPEADAAFAKNANVGNELVRDLIANPRGVSDTEVFILNRVAMDLQTEKANLSKKEESGKVDWKERVVLEDKEKDFYEALSQARTKTAQGLAALGALWKDKYSLATFEQILERYNESKPLSEEQKAKAKAAYEASKPAVEEFQKMKARVDQLEAEAEELRKPKTEVENWEEVVRNLTQKYNKVSKVKLATKASSYEKYLKNFYTKDTGARKSLPAEEGKKLDSRVEALRGLIMDQIARGNTDPAKVREALEGRLGKTIMDDLRPLYKESFMEALKELPKYAEKEIVSKEEATKTEADIVNDDTATLGQQVKELVDLEARRGTKTFPEAVKNIMEKLKGRYEDLSEREIRDAYTDYDKPATPATEDKLKLKKIEWKHIGTLLSNLDDIQKKIKPPKHGQQRPPPTLAERELVREVNKALKAAGLRSIDGDLSRKSALDAVKTRLKNQIEELDKAIAPGGKKIETNKTPLDYGKDPEIKPLIEKRDALKARYEEIFPEERTAKTQAERLESAKIAVVSRMEKIQEQIKERKRALAPEKLQKDKVLLDLLEGESALKKILDDVAPKEGMDEKAEAKRIKQLNEDIADLDVQIAKGERIFKGLTKKTDSPEVARLKEIRDAKREVLDSIDPKVITDEVRIERALKVQESQLEKAQAELERAKKGDFSKPERKLGIETPAIREAREEVEHVKARIKDLKDAQGLTNAGIIARRIKAVNRQMRETDIKLASGDFSKGPTREDVTSPELQEAQLKMKIKLRELEGARNKFEAENMSTTQKMQKTFLAWRRGFILSGPITIFKLQSAAMQRFGFMGIEEGLGKGIGAFIPKIAREASIEGTHAGFKAMGRAYAKMWSKMGKDVMQTLKTGHSELDYLYGKVDGLPPEAINLFGRIHGALKAPVKRFAFEYAMEKQFEHGLSRGMDVQSPVIQMAYMTKAYQYANRQIFMQQNAATEWWRSGIKRLRSGGAVSNAVATAMEATMPIVTVPTNVVGETIRYATGLITGSAKVAKAMRGAFDSLPQAEKEAMANDIMADLKKGSVGAVMMMLGYYLSDAIGGYYEPGEKRKKGEVKPGNLRTWWGDLPPFLLHSPAMEILQMGSTVRRVAESFFKKDDKEGQGLMKGVLRASLGLLEQVPFVRETGDISKVFNPREQDSFWGDYFKSLVVPRAVQTVAEKMDTKPGGFLELGETISRKPKGLTEYVKTGIPVLREEVEKRHEEDMTIAEKRKKRLGIR